MSWTSIFSESLTFINATDDRSFHPVTLNSVSGSQLAIVASNPTAKPTWYLACNLAIVAAYSDFPIASPTPSEVLRRRVGLDQYTLIDVPAGIVFPYQVQLEVPYWHDRLTVQVWQRSEADDRQMLTAASAGQTEFKLAAAPAQPQTSELYINGIKATYGTEYRIEGDRLLWLAALPLDPSDEIELLTP